MSTAARIEELRKKFDENPRRYFAPLANELRKAGELTQAIALCREHLPKQPGHMSGYIVFGQALFEVGELDEARTVFEQALSLDPENLIALHHLGHIARQQGDTAAARRWYERALETDPRNDDIAHQLAALATPVRPQPAIPTPVSPAAVDPERELAFLEAGVVVPRRDLGAIPTPPTGQEAIGAIPTPPMSQEAIGAMPLEPTPDAAMRAVDFDVVNESLSQAHEDAQPFAAAPATEPAPADEAESFAVASNEPIDLTFDEPVADAFVADSSIALTVDVIASGDGPSGQALADDPFVFADDELADAPLGDTGAAAPIDLDAAFEEGLVTAGWPDPSELAAVATPRAVTPLNVEVTPDAVEAFGREAGDPVAAPLPEPEVDVLGDDADLMSRTPASPVSAIVEVDAVSAGMEEVSLDVDEVSADAGPAAELPWLAAPVTPTEDVNAIVQALEEDARALGEADDVSMLALAGDIVPSSPEPAAIDEASFSDVHPADAAFAEPLAEPLVETVAEAVDAEEADAPEEAAAQSPAFVTETMGELLVAQGFTDRAVVVYEELVRRRPYDPVLSARLAELREQLETATPVPVYTARERYAALAARRVIRRTPVRPYTPISSTVVTPRSATPIANTPIASTPFSAVPAVMTPVASPVVSPAIAAEDSLASLFGAEAQSPDDFAAQALADAFAPLPMDAAPASDTFATSFLGTPDAARTPTPAYGAVRQPTPVAVPPVPPPSTDAGPEFSFDRFFPDPAAQTGTPSSGAREATPDAAPAAGEATPGEDLAQFSAWLKGLGQS